MRTTLSTSIILLGMLLFSACGGSGGPDKEGNGGDTLAVARIQAMEDSLYARPGVDRKGAQALLDVYLAYAKLHLSLIHI